jgi:RNA polymerase sigma-70 factor (ECF subfamily)
MPSQDPPTDGSEHLLTTQHVHAARLGDAASLEWLVARLSPLLRELAAHRLGPVLRSHCDPDDLVNDAWLAAIPKLAQLTAQQGRYTPVLLRYLGNTILFRIEKLVRKHARQTPQAAAADEPPPEVPAEASGAITRAVRAEQRDLVREALAALEPGDREVLLLRGVEQMSTNAVAVVLAATPAAVSKRYQRALLRLRTALPGSVFDELDDA